MEALETGAQFFDWDEKGRLCKANFHIKKNARNQCVWLHSTLTGKLCVMPVQRERNLRDYGSRVRP